MPDQPTRIPVRDASTVILLRPAPDSDEGFEVYLTRRRPELVFVGGMHVFPGGKVDPEDSDPGAVARSEGLSPERAAELLQEEAMAPARAFAFWVGAVRELFEEAGVLLAYRGDDIVDLCAPGALEPLEEWRRRLNANEAGIADMLAQEDLRLALDRLHYVSHWITPVGPPRRFNTHFFLAEMPENQQPCHHEGEVDESLWIGPRKALAAWAENRIAMIPPTVMSLQTIAAFRSLEDVMKNFPRP
ncbi:MAG: NUDIX hydrolase [Deltaproteobacteria bacterium]|nr:NUDIX hydrolase [Deltaproteobacteria bacterium]